MILYLVRHAEAKPEEDDPERPLSEKGRDDVGRVARYAAGHLAIEVDRVLHSGKTRARQTAEVLSEVVRPTVRLEAAESLEPLADPQVWGSRLRETQGDLMLVGHYPHLVKLASLLLCGDGGALVLGLESGGVLCLERGEQGTWSVRWMLGPRIV